MNHRAKTGWGRRSRGAILSLFLIVFARAGVLVAGGDEAAGAEIGQAYQEGPLGARSEARYLELPTSAENALAFGALVAIVIGLRVSGLSRSRGSRRRSPPAGA